MSDTDAAPEPISDALDALVCATIDYGLDMLGEVAELAVTLAVEDGVGNQALLSFDDVDVEECLAEARATVSDAARGKKGIDGLQGKPVRYAIAYDGAVSEEEGSAYDPALIVEYGETGLSRAYSAFLVYENAGDPQEFMWTEPAAAGITDLLV